MDLLQKLATDLQTEVVQASEQAQPQAKPFVAMAVTVGKDAEHLEAANHLFDDHPLLGQQAIGPPPLGSQLPTWRLAVGRRAQGMQVLDALVALVRQERCRRWQGWPGPLVDAEVVLPPFADAHVQDALALHLDEELALEGVALLLARVVGPLLFFGRSTGVSATSTTTVPSTVRTARLPGRAKRPDPTSAASTRRTMRQAVAS
jgi:hypothetical protein